MDTLVIEPRTKSDARFLRSVSKRIGAPVRTLEEIEDDLFAQELIERRKNFNIVPEEEYKNMVARKLAE